MQSNCHRNRLSRLLLSAALCAALFVNLPAAQALAPKIIRVAPDGTTAPGCGLTWAAPCDLQFTLTVLANAGDTIWARAGTYKPSPIAARDTSFVLRQGVSLYGGFAGTENSINERILDPAAPSILSGEYGDPANDGDNAYNVVRAVGISGLALDGFTITGGYADGAGPTYGGGLYVSSSVAYFSNLIIQGNRAILGGGAFIFSGASELRHVTIQGNRADFYGGGLFTQSSSPPAIIASEITGNSALRGGGAYIYGGGASFQDVSFRDNSASTNGGGVYSDFASPEFIRSTFDGNHANNQGGGLYTINSSGEPAPAKVENCLFKENSAEQGGGIFVFGPALLSRSSFISNEASYNGGGVYAYSNATQPFSNLTFYRNSTANEGAAILFYNSNLDARGLTVSENTSRSGSGGAIANILNPLGTGPNVRVSGSIIWNNAGKNFCTISGANTSLSDSVAGMPSGVDGTCPPGTTGCSGVLNVDPLLAPPGLYDSLTPVMPLLPGSLAIDRVGGAACQALATDQRGIARPQLSSCDAGAFESRGFTFTQLFGGGQTAQINTPYAFPLSVGVTSPYGEPVDGGEVYFYVPASGPGVLGGSPSMPWFTVPITAGEAEASLWANGEAGAFTVNADLYGGTPERLPFSLENTLPPKLIFIPLVVRQ